MLCANNARLAIIGSHDFAPADRLAYALVSAVLALTQAQLGNRSHTLHTLGDIQRDLLKQIETAPSKLTFAPSRHDPSADPARPRSQATASSATSSQPSTALAGRCQTPSSPGPSKTQHRPPKTHPPTCCPACTKLSTRSGTSTRTTAAQHLPSSTSTISLPRVSARASSRFASARACWATWRVERVDGTRCCTASR